jgi:hypothetical protein
MSLPWDISAYSIGPLRLRRAVLPDHRAVVALIVTPPYVALGVPGDILLHLEHCHGRYRSWSEENHGHRQTSAPISEQLSTSMPPHTPPRGGRGTHTRTTNDRLNRCRSCGLCPRRTKAETNASVGCSFDYTFHRGPGVRGEPRFTILGWRRRSKAFARSGQTAFRCQERAKEYPCRT